MPLLGEEILYRRSERGRGRGLLLAWTGLLLLGSLTVALAQASAQDPAYVPVGHVFDDEGDPVAGASVTLPLVGADVRTTTGADGRFVLEDAVGRSAPQRVLIQVEKQGFESETATLDTQVDPWIEVTLERDNPGEIELGNDVYHLGDGDFGGQINARFQRTVQGGNRSFAFDLTPAQARARTAELVLDARGVQRPNEVSLNGVRQDALADSPSSGRLGTQAVPLDASLLEPGPNELTVRSVAVSSGDLDDFEMVNPRVRLAGETIDDTAPEVLASDGDELPPLEAGEDFPASVPGPWFTIARAEDETALETLQATLVRTAGDTDTTVAEVGGEVPGDEPVHALTLDHDLEANETYTLQIVAADTSGNLRELEKRLPVRSGPDLAVTLQAPDAITLTDPAMSVELPLGEGPLGDVAGFEVTVANRGDAPARRVPLELSTPPKLPLDYNALRIELPGGDVLACGQSPPSPGEGGDLRADPANLDDCGNEGIRCSETAPSGNSNRLECTLTPAHGGLDVDESVHLVAEATPWPGEGTPPGEPSTFEAAASAEVADTASPEVDPSDNRDTRPVRVAPVHVGGSVQAVGPDNRLVPLPDVEVRIESDFRSETVHTDEDGAYAMSGLLPRTAAPWGTVRIEASLEDGDGLVRVDSDAVEQLGSTVELRTNPVAVSDVLSVQPPEASNRDPRILARLDLVFSRDHDLVDESRFTVAEDARGEPFRAAANAYRETREALDFAREELGVALDHAMPVDVLLDVDREETAHARYYPHGDGTLGLPPSSISVEPEASRTRHSITDPPIIEYHEAGHHVHLDGPIGGEDAGQQPCLFLCEGFAQFYALWVDQDPVTARHNYETAVGGEVSGFAVAPLLWDLLDAHSDRGDDLSLGPTGLWRILSTLPADARGSDDGVRALYERLADEGVGQDPLNARYNPFLDARTLVKELDAVFAVHGFYHDANGNGTWEPAREPAGWRTPPPDAGEASGERGDSLEEEIRREDDEGYPRREPGSWIRLETVNDTGAPLPVSRYVVSYESPNQTFNRGALLSPTPEGRVLLQPGGDVRRIRIQPQLTGHAVQPLAIANDTDEEGLAQARRANRSTFANHTFVATPVEVPRPGSVQATPVNRTHARVSWNATGEVLVVRGAGHPPTTAADGTLVYRGSEGTHLDAIPATGQTYHYTVFGISEDDRLSPGRSASTGPAWTPPARELDVGGTGAGWVLALGLAALAAAGVRAWSGDGGRA